MGLFKAFKKKFERITRNDPVFGSISYHRSGQWEGGTVAFTPTGTQVEVIIDAGEEGPAESQREFYRELERRYPELSDEIAGVLHGTFTNWKEDFPRQNIWLEFDLTAICIPDLSASPPEWELFYTCASDEHSFDIQMEGWKSVGLSLTGKRIPFS